MTIQVLSPGIYTTMQDLGRKGFQHIGVSPSGVMDEFAHRIANILVGNDENCATLEMTLTGATLKFNEASYIAVTGAEFSPTIDGVKVDNWRRIKIEKGSILQFSKRKEGCRAYLAISGGFKGENWLGSSSTSLQVKLGGHSGRSLQKNDLLVVNDSQETIFVGETAKWKVSPHVYHFYKEPHKISVIKGRQYEKFSKESLKHFFESSYVVSSNSNRMGYRLEGEPLARVHETPLISEGVCNGTVQVPPDGQPIILMAERQTIGGYSKIAQVASTDLPKLAQCIPGDKLSFQLVSLEEAQNKRIVLEKELQLLKAAVKLKGRM
jgi:antagonist of KipI